MENSSSIYALPPDSIRLIISLTSPRDACNCSLVSPIIRRLADSDVVWESFLPSDHREIIARSVSNLTYATKKDLYVRLSHYPILIDGGIRSFGLEKRSGKKCFMVAARMMWIIWGENTSYWRWISLPESRFPEVAELIEVWWFHLGCRLEARMLSDMTTYAAYLVFKIADRGCSGFDERPIELSVRFGTQHKIKHSAWAPKERVDGWMEIEMGEFFNDYRDGEEVEMNIRQVSDYSRKSGIVVQGMELRPKETS